MTAPGVAGSNAEAARAWDGPHGDLWTDNADHFDAQTADYLPAIMEAAAIVPDAAVLDVGCGAGRLTQEAARLAPRGSATGVDLSTRLLDLARGRAAAAGFRNVRFERADAQTADLGTGRYDRIVSRNGVMFFADPVAAFTNLARALRPGGRLALGVWQAVEHNPWFPAFRRAVAAGRELPPLATDGPGAFSFGDPERVRRLLTAAGFTEPHFADVRAPVHYGDPAAAEVVVSGIVRGLLDELDEPARAGAQEALRATLREHLGPDGVRFGSAMWIITAGRA
ncbi:class I SAM-dependent methyltransferase [Pseudonocardia lacus]|uniref:class I SAM-dependent methyltransferase n=1 Tax=Pseudonocardia lacus TaxID=2835865 RepID=UPI001BDCA5F2|nr:class I SAM-dependent methyltransferase [Pseudonocardia lacus]